MAEHVNKLLLRDHEAAEMLGISRSSVHRLRNTGQFPLPVRMGASVRWRKVELEQWVEAGCPATDVWEKTRRNRRPAASLTPSR